MKKLIQAYLAIAAGIYLITRLKDYEQSRSQPSKVAAVRG